MSVVFTQNAVTPNMETCADKVNMLVSGGTSQADRFLKQLDPAYIAVNEKTQQQWLTFTANMSECLNYYNAQNVADGDWSAFFNQDLVSYARLSLQDTTSIQNYFGDLLAILQSTDESAYTSAQRCDAFATICFSLFSLCFFIDDQLVSTQANSDYNNRLTDLVGNKLKQPLTKLIGYVIAAGELRLLGNLSTLVPPIPLFGAQILTGVEMAQKKLKSSVWFSPSPDFDTYMASVEPVYSLFTNAVNKQPLLTNNPQYNQLIWRSFLRASAHNLFTSVVNTFIYACGYIRQLNADAYASSIATGQLPPHLSLYFSFLTMLQEAQNDLNQFTERHLNFFYENVLKLGPSPAQSNQAHLSIQLSRNHMQGSLPAGTLFNAGKDNTGVNVSYTLLHDTTFNHASVAALKSLYIAGQLGENDDNASNGLKNGGKAFAASVANSADGVGKEIISTPASWQAFGNKSVSNTRDVTMLMPLAHIGFAIASQYLYLQEGQREIKIQLFTEDASAFQSMPTVAPPFKCRLTTPGVSSGWTTVEPASVTMLTTGGSDPSVVFTIALSAGFPAVGGYSAKVNGQGMDTDLPVIEFTLMDDDFSKAGYFQSLRNISFSKCVINVTVGSANINGNLTASTFNGLKKLYISNDGGAIDASQPFSPFGAPAAANASLNVGCRELFLKPGASYSLLVEHTDIPDYSNPPANSTTGYSTWYWGAALWYVNTSYPEFWNVSFNNCNSWACIIEDLLVPVNAYQQAVDSATPKLSVGYLEGGVWKNFTQPYDYPIANPPADINWPTTKADPFGILASGSIPGITNNSQSVLNYETQVNQYNQSSTGGFLKVVLNRDFGIELYNAAMIQYRLDQSMASARSLASTTATATTTGGITTTDTSPGAENFKAFQPVAPYTPVVKNISLNYTASVTLDLKSAQTNPGNEYVRYYYLYPFGVAELTCPVPALNAIKGQGNLQLTDVSSYQALTLNADSSLKIPIGQITWSSSGSPLPAIPSQWYPNIFPSFSGVINGARLSFVSEFYIGIVDLHPGENVNLLFQVLDGSTNPLLSAPESQQIFWFCLSNNDWLALDSVIDNTNQLTQSGIISFSIPYSATVQNTMLDPGYIWIKAGLTGYPDTVCKLISILPQAALVQFVDKGNSKFFLQQQLPSGSITKLVKPLASIKQITQPFASFGGKIAEDLQTFRVRVSERLRHKDRAIQIWDYEHLILQEFTNIQKVKCLNHTEFNPGAGDGILYSEQVPGHVTIVTIPYISQNSSSNILKPYTSVSILNAIKKFIGSRVSSQVTIHVQNPVFEEIRFDFKVKFSDGVDVSYYSNLLNQAIVQYLSPWAFSDGVDVAFGGVIYKAAVVNFIEGLSYVSYITDVHMSVRLDLDSQYSSDKDTAIASKGISVLVSAPVHSIIPLN